MTDDRKFPESKRYAELKGKSVAVLCGHPTSQVAGQWVGELCWVDTYTIGLCVQNSPLAIGAKDQVWIINKAWIVAIGEHTR